ncbi:hypothetical protein AVEN_61713-1 [Araneus ventricosus]|uniref:Uncharacterized protein n=1 Tax=Araneus ventricosus TaxID=182803 RepID=A0A4Y2R068_ARAVE|nr:hypothetical protein AVEN_240231-1 [Araneus ventricosus]GBN69013.1 hypothetical protein AVEN_61713-1 [Araneus ventricosus]
MPRHCIVTLRGIVKCRANSTTSAIIAVRQEKSFEVGRERSMLREEDNIAYRWLDSQRYNHCSSVIDPEESRSSSEFRSIVVKCESD